ncbi:MAG: hypothetical protein IPP83_02205 [Flavobacteriales bacterium]|nr:hypothetical protein [Flavobacteriales bacterium]
MALAIVTSSWAQTGLNALVIEQGYPSIIASLPIVFSDRTLSESFVCQEVWGTPVCPYPLFENQHCDLGKVVYPALLGDLSMSHGFSTYGSDSLPSAQVPWFVRVFENDSLVRRVWLSNQRMKEWVNRALSSSKTYQDKCLSNLLGQFHDLLIQVYALEMAPTAVDARITSFDKWVSVDEVREVSYYEPNADLTPEYDSLVLYIHIHGTVDERMEQCFEKIEYGYTPLLLDDGRYAIMHNRRRELYVYKSLQGWLEYFEPNAECY